MGYRKGRTPLVAGKAISSLKRVNTIVLDMLLAGVEGTERITKDDMVAFIKEGGMLDEIGSRLGYPALATFPGDVVRLEQLCLQFPTGSVCFKSLHRQIHPTE
jgi:hypothetical protein